MNNCITIDANLFTDKFCEFFIFLRVAYHPDAQLLLRRNGSKDA